MLVVYYSSGSEYTHRFAGKLRHPVLRLPLLTRSETLHVDEPFDILFLPEPSVAPDSEIELSDQDCDVVFHDGAAIDLGAALADTLALSLDPYPRSPDADEALREAGVLSEEQAGPFAALAALKKG